MKSIKLLAFAFMVLVSACKEEDPIYPNPANLQEEIENIIQPLVNSKKTVGAAVGIIMPGGEKEMFFFGEKTKGQGDTPDKNTLFELGSIVKTMTASVLADKVLKGEIKLDDPVENYLPGITNFPNYNGDKITFLNLANHTSSLPRMPGNHLEGGFDYDQPFLHYSKDMLYEFLDGYVLEEPIGSKGEYSNLGFVLLGHTLGEISGTPFSTQLQQTVFDRLGMNHSFTEIPDGMSNVAQPYNKNRKAIPAWIMSDVMLGAGGVKSSLEDMLIYLEENMGYGNSDLKEALALCHQNTFTVQENISVGMDWINAFKEADGTTLSYHNGRTYGSTAFIGFIKELDLGVVLLFNCDVPSRAGEEGHEKRKAIEVLQAMMKY